MSIIRKLDHDELGMHLMQHNFSGSFNVVSAITIDGEKDMAKLRKVMNQFIELMPQLRATIDSRGLHFMDLNNPYEWEMIEYVDSGYSINQAIEKELNTNLNAQGGHLWRLSTLCNHQNNTWSLIFYFHHCIIDAFSRSRFFKEFLESYSQGYVDPSKVSLTEGFPKPIVDFLPERNQGFKGVLTTLGYLTGVIRSTMLNRLTYRKLKAPFNECSAHIHTIKIEKSDFEAFKAEAKRNQASVHGALCAAKMFALKSLFRGEKPTFGILSTINTRPKLDTEASKGLCPRVGHSIKAAKIGNQESFWKIARELGNGVRSDIEKGHDMAGGKLLVQHIKRLVKKRKTLPSACNLQIANGGKLPIKKEYGNLTVTDVRYVQNFIAVGNIIASLTISLNGELTNTICYTSPQYSENEIAVYARAFKNQITNI